MRKITLLFVLLSSTVFGNRVGGTLAQQGSTTQVGLMFFPQE